MKVYDKQGEWTRVFSPRAPRGCVVCGAKAPVVRLGLGKYMLRLCREHRPVARPVERVDGVIAVHLVARPVYVLPAGAGRSSVIFPGFIG